MKYLFVAFLFLLSVSKGSAQPLQGLLDALHRPQTDSSKIANYQAIIEYFRYHSFDSALIYAKEGLAYAQMKQYPFGQGVMMNSLGQVNERHGQLELAKAQYTEARQIFSNIGYTKGVAMTTNGLGVVAGRTGKYDEATRHFLEALERFEEMGDTYGLVQTYIKLGVVSDLLGNLDDALEYYLKAEKLNTAGSSSNASLTLLNNIGIVYGKRNNVLTALKYFHRGLRESDPQKSTGIYITLLGSLGTAYEKLGNPDSAFYYQEQALSMARKNNLPEEEARALVNMASLVSADDPSKSLAFLDQALVITEGIQHMSLMTEIYASMIRLYKEQDNYKQALDLSEKCQQLKDSLFSLQKSKEIANLHATHELARQENKIQDLAVMHEKSMTQRNIMIVIALVSVGLIGIVWYYNTKVSNLNTELIRKQNELKNSNSIKDKLFSILGHDLRAPLGRVIGLLNVLSLKQTTPDETMIIEKLRQQSVNTLETLDNLLLWGQRQLKGVRLNQQRLDLREHVRKSIQLAADYASQKDVKIVDCIPADISIHADPSHFDFIIRNLLSNAVKFSHSGGVIVLNADTHPDKQVVLSIKDSGIGISKAVQEEIFTPGNESIRGTWNEKGTGIGLMLCREYIGENGGRLWVESEAGKGATFYISFQQTDRKATTAYETAEA